jgi:hypothetical protein
MVQPYPTAAQLPGTEPRSAPASVRNAVKVMYAGAAAEIIHAILFIVTESSTRAHYASKHPRLSAAKVTTGAHALAFSGAIGAVIGAALFIWIALMCLRGRNWARITGTVFFAVGVLGALVELRVALGPVDKIWDFVIVLVGLAAVILLWQGRSSDYFKSSSQPVS